MKRLVVVYHTQSGSTERLVQAVADGATHPHIEGVDTRLLSALEAGPEDILAADGVILGTPENFGYMSGAMKYFFDRIYYACLDHTQGLPYAVFIKAGNDGLGAKQSMARIITGLAWREVQEPVIVVGDLDEGHIQACRELGMGLAAGLEAGLF